MNVVYVTLLPEDTSTASAARNPGEEFRGVNGIDVMGKFIVIKFKKSQVLIPDHRIREVVLEMDVEE